MADNEIERVRVNPTFLIGVGLLVITAWLFWPTTGFHWLIFDDDRYVTDNPWIKSGLSWTSVRWAFSTFDEEFWHPLTWLSYFFDHSIYGLFAGGYHLTNLLLHSLNTLLLFLCLRRLTHAVWSSALVAALFGWHPLHVESVAWIADRKDVLSGTFMMLTLWVYSQYSDAVSDRDPKSKLFYTVALSMFACGLMSKSMLVTLPCVLLLLDFWPLKRFTLPGCRVVIGRLIAEKIPFFALSLAVGVMSIIAERAGGSLKSAEQVPILLRVLNSFASYGYYICDTVFPINLCAYYPLPRKLPIWPAVCSFLLLSIVSFLVFRRRSSAPWLAVGWLWFLGMLTPVIGLLQVGSHAMADRYTYLPSIGLFIMVIWSFRDWLKTHPSFVRLAIGVCGVVLLSCVTASRVQLWYWSDSIAMFERAVSVTENNAIAHNNLGVALADAGRIAEAIDEHALALQISSKDSGAHYDIGVDLANAGQLRRAAYHFAEGLKFSPNDYELHNNLGVVLAQQGEVAAALPHFQQAILLQPDYPKAYLNCAEALEKLGQTPAAVTNYDKALALQADWPEALDRLANLLITCRELEYRDPVAAVKFASRANELTRRRSAVMLTTLAAAQAAAGNFSAAADTAEGALVIARIKNLKELVAQIEARLESYKMGRNPEPGATNLPAQVVSPDK